MHDMKRQFIRSLINASKPDSEEKDNDVYFTYFTNIGIVIGIKKDVEGWDPETPEAYKQELRNKIKDQEPVSIYDRSNALLHLMLKKSIYDYNFENSDPKVIILEDVLIIGINNREYKLESFVLFTDQITGIYPGKFL